MIVPARALTPRVHQRQWPTHCSIIYMPQMCPSFSSYKTTNQDISWAHDFRHHESIRNLNHHLTQKLSTLDKKQNTPHSSRNPIYTPPYVPLYQMRPTLPPSAGANSLFPYIPSHNHLRFPIHLPTPYPPTRSPLPTSQPWSHHMLFTFFGKCLRQNTHPISITISSHEGLYLTRPSHTFSRIPPLIRGG